MRHTQKVKQVYQNGFAQTEKQLNEPRLKQVLVIVQKLQSKPINRLLDIGCGDGSFTQIIAGITQAKKIFGVDISKKAVDSARRKKINAYCLDVDESNLPFHSNTFDFIFCGNLIELVADADHLLTELYRVLKKSGILIITFPNICSWGSRVAVLLGYLPYYSRISTKYDLGKFMGKTKKGDSTGFIRLFSLRSFIKLASFYNLTVIKTFGAKADGLPVFLSPIDSFFSHFPSFAFQTITILKKT